MVELEKITSVPLLEEDIDALLEIEAGSFTAPWSRRMFLEELANRNSTVSVFRYNNKIVGYVCYWTVLDEAHLMNIAVHPAYRNKGIGFKILSQLENQVRQLGICRILLEVAKRNLPARALYQKAGFVTFGFRKLYYTADKDDAILMEKTLHS